MARTWNKRGASAHAPSDAFLNHATRTMPEGASQTWKAGSFLSLSSGLLVPFTAPGTAKIAAFALEDGQNTTGALAKVLLVTGDVEFYMNVLTSSAADYVLLAADFGKAYDITKATNFPTTSAAQYYLQATTSDTAGRISQLMADEVPPTELASVLPAAGDTNARVRVRIDAAARLFT